MRSLDARFRCPDLARVHPHGLSRIDVVRGWQVNSGPNGNNDVVINLLWPQGTVVLRRADVNEITVSHFSSTEAADGDWDDAYPDIDEGGRAAHVTPVFLDDMGPCIVIAPRPVDDEHEFRELILAEWQVRQPESTGSIAGDLLVDVPHDFPHRVSIRYASTNAIWLDGGDSGAAGFNLMRGLSVAGGGAFGRNLSFRNAWGTMSAYGENSSVRLWDAPDFQLGAFQGAKAVVHLRDLLPFDVAAGPFEIAAVDYMERISDQEALPFIETDDMENVAVLTSRKWLLSVACEDIQPAYEFVREGNYVPETFPRTELGRLL